MKTARVQLVPTRRTDLVCMSCGRFRTEFAVVPIGGDTTRETIDSHVGVHRACVDRVHSRRKTSKLARAANGALDAPRGES
jgi:hypothetical protein